MKFSIDKHYLIEPLKKVASALPSKDIIPILSGILFNASDEGLTMTAGNTEFFVSAVVDPDNFELNQTGSIVLPGSTVLEIVQKSNSDLTFEVKGTAVAIKTSTNKFKLNGIESDDFPVIPNVNAETITLQGKMFKKLIHKTLFATADEKAAMPIITGINFEFSNDHIKATATNRTRLARSEIPYDANIEFSTVVSSESLNAFLKVATDKEIEFKFAYDGFLATMEGLTFWSRVLEGTYPAVGPLLNVHSNYSAVFDTKEMILALENVEIVAKEDKVRKAKMTISNELLLESMAKGGNAAVSVPLSDVQGEGMVIAFNIKYFIDALKSLDSEKTVIQLKSKLEPIILYGQGDESSKYIVLPFRVAEV